MNLFFSSINLLSGVELSAPGASVTGEWHNTARSREFLFTVYNSGAAGATVTLQYKSPFFNNEGVDFLIFSGLSPDTYSQPVYATSPFSEIRAVATAGSGQSGVGTVFAAATLQN
jgi:hypothetical protein